MAHTCASAGGMTTEGRGVPCAVPAQHAGPRCRWGADINHPNPGAGAPTLARRPAFGSSAAHAKPAGRGLSRGCPPSL